MAMADGVTVRAAQPEEIEALAGMAGKLVRLHHELDPLRFFVPERVEHGYGWWFRQEIQRSEVVLLIALRGDKAIGYAYARLEERDWNRLLDSCGALHDLWVEPEERRAGVGRALVEAAFQALRDKGAPRVVLNSAMGNERAQALFASLGFRRTMVEMTREA